jgi:hypothetical protein
VASDGRRSLGAFRPHELGACKRRPTLRGECRDPRLDEPRPAPRDSEHGTVGVHVDFFALGNGFDARCGDPARAAVGFR